MKISKLRSILLSHAYDTPLEWVGGHIASWDAAIVEVTLYDGITGVGEVGQGIMAAIAVPGIVDALASYVIGKTFGSSDELGDFLRSRSAFWARGGISSSVIGAIETALWDAAAKLAGQPLYDMFGGLAHERLELYASGGLGTTFEEVANWAIKQEQSGLRIVKFRAMWNAERTIELLDYVVPRLRQTTQFVLDAVQGCASNPWRTEDAIRVGTRVAELGGRWFEEPCHAQDIRGYVDVRRAVNCQISGVESFTSRYEFQHLIEEGGVDIVQPDVSIVGGPTEFKRVVSLAERATLACAPHVWGSGVTLMTNLHMAFSTENTPLLEYCTLPNPLREALLAAPLDIVGGYVLPPKTAGLGIELSPDIEARFPFKAGGGHVIR